MGITRHPLFSTPVTDQMAHIPADAELIRRLEESFQHISARGDEFTAEFYRRLFAARPDLRAMFPPDMTAQRGKLLESLRMVIAHLNSPDRVHARLDELGRSHVGYGARPEHYPVVCEILVAAMGDLLGDAWTAGLKEDWATAFRLVSSIMLEGARQAPSQPPKPDLDPA
jgi:nitric oxide dioxygenase